MAGREAVLLQVGAAGLQVAAGAGVPAGSAVPHCFRMGSGASTAGSALSKTEAPGAETSTCTGRNRGTGFLFPSSTGLCVHAWGWRSRAEHGVLAHTTYPPTALSTAGGGENPAEAHQALRGIAQTPANRTCCHPTEAHQAATRERL